jgi:hypothetical protein
LKFFGSSFCVLVAAQTTKKKRLVQHDLYSFKASTFPHLHKKKIQNHNENWHHKNLPKLPIVPSRNFGALGVKSYAKQNEQDCLKYFGSVFGNLKAQYVGLW